MDTVTENIILKFLLGLHMSNIQFLFSIFSKQCITLSAE